MRTHSLRLIVCAVGMSLAGCGSSEEDDASTPAGTGGSSATAGAGGSTAGAGNTAGTGGTSGGQGGTSAGQGGTSAGQGGTSNGGTAGAATGGSGGASAGQGGTSAGSGGSTGGAAGAAGSAGMGGNAGPGGAAGAAGSAGTGGDAGPGGSAGAAGTSGAAGSSGSGGTTVAYPAPHMAPPTVQTLGGPVLAAPRFVPVFFTGDDADLVTAIVDQETKMGASKYWAATTSEYGVGPATASPVVQLTEMAPSTIDDPDVRAWLAGKLNGNDLALPASDENTVYVLHYPTGTSVTVQGSTGCQDFGGYHSNITLDAAHGTKNVAYLVLPRCTSFDGLTGADALSAPASQLLINAATDPYPVTAPAYASIDEDHREWGFALGDSEVAGLCAQNADAFVTLPELPHTVQRSWSNKAALAGHDPCVPAPAGQVYFNAAPALTTPIALAGTMALGVQIPVGETKTIEIDLFSEAPTSGPFTVSALDGSTLTGGSPKLELSIAPGDGVNGDKLQLTIKVLQASQFGAELFYLSSSLNGAEHLWIGVVGN